MRVRSKKHALELRDQGATFYNRYGNPAQVPEQGTVHVDYYKAALQHLYNTINSFDYIYEGDGDRLEQVEAEKQWLVAEKHRLEEEIRGLQEELRTREEPPPRTAAPRRRAQASAASWHEAGWTGTRYGADVLPGPSAALLRYLLQGQRNFLDHHSDAGVAGALSFLIQHALAQLQAVPPGFETARQAFYADLHTIASKLCTYRGHTLNGFQSAVEELRACLPGIEDLAATLPTTKTKRSEAKLFQETLKLLRDQVRLDFRPYFYEVDPHDGTIFAIG